MSKVFNNRIDTAHALIDEHDYDTPVELMQNLRNRIHDQDILTKCTMHDMEVEKQFNARYVSICQKKGDPMERTREVLGLKKERAQEYVKFYDKLTKDHDL